MIIAHLTFLAVCHFWQKNAKQPQETSCRFNKIKFPGEFFCINGKPMKSMEPCSNDRSHTTIKQNRYQKNAPFFLSWILFFKISGKCIRPRDRETQVLHKLAKIFSHTYLRRLIQKILQSKVE